MSTHFTLDFSIAWLATETLGLYPQLELRRHQTAKVAGKSISKQPNLNAIAHLSGALCICIHTYRLC